MPPQFQASVLFVRDVKASRRFYEDLLGQKVLVDHGPNVGFEGGFAIWQVDHAYQVIDRPTPDPTERLGRENFELYFEADDLEATWSQLSGAGVRVTHPIREQPWGQRVFRVLDPDDHMVEIGEPIPLVVNRLLAQGMTVEAVAERVSMPPEVVQRIAGTGA